MARPCRWRRICTVPEFDRFVPEGIPSPGSITLTVDEYEAVRLIDLMKCTHEQCAAQMDISRTTVTEIYESARTKIADSLIGGKTLVIAGGRYRLCDGTGPLCCHRCRRNAAQSPQQITEKGEHIMRIAVTYENGTIFQHFDHTEQFKLYDVENGEIRHSEVVDTNGSGHGALAGFLTAHQVDALICGGIGGGAQTALAQAGIRLYGGVSGSADEAAAALAAGQLTFNPNVHCTHHEHEHGSGHHTCGEHGCGKH